MIPAHAINFSWILKLRWGAIAGQLGVIALARSLVGIQVPIGALLAIVAAEGLSNLWLARWCASAPDAIREAHIAAVLMADVVALTGLLALTGGASNPFSSLYLVYVALAAVILAPRSTWALVLLAFGCYGALFRVGGSHAAHAQHGPAEMRLHLHGMWVAFGVAASFIVAFVQRVRRALAARDRDLEAARESARRAERLASLATLAAGAAHELASPLSTIAVAAKEVERALRGAAVPAAVSEDAQLIREQVERCREILNRLAADAGQSVGEASEAMALEVLLAEVAAAAPPGSRVTASVAPEARRLHFLVPRRTLTQVLGSLLTNAVQASAPAAPIAMRAVLCGGGIVFEVEDHGSGMTPDMLARAGEPFFTTKPPSGPGRGMGLGLFLANAVAERLGGRLALDSAPGRGTTARLTIHAVRAEPALEPPAPGPAPMRVAS